MEQGELEDDSQSSTDHFSITVWKFFIIFVFQFISSNVNMVINFLKYELL